MIIRHEFDKEYTTIKLIIVLNFIKNPIFSIYLCANTNGFNLIIFHFNVHGKLSIIRCVK